MENIIGLLKKFRKQNDLKKRYSSKYAFIGIGNHSINNLYPVINYLHVPLKYIVSRSQSTAGLIKENYPNITGTTDLNAVLSDNEINGVFISANPDYHYEIVKDALLHKKNVFVEKPPCKNIEELNELSQLEKASGKTCIVGLQKRYSVCSKILKREIAPDDIISYNYRFIVGSYPEGDPLWDLFIHPVDLITYLFGDAKLLSISKSNQSKGKTTVFIHSAHKNIIGSVEMSTEYSWDNPCECLIVNTKKGVYKMQNHQLLTFEPKAGNILSMPKEKIFPSVPEKKYLFNGNNFLPVFENNQLVSQGYFNEIKAFLDISEKYGKAKNNSPLMSLKNTYELLSEIKK